MQEQNKTMMSRFEEIERKISSQQQQREPIQEQSFKPTNDQEDYQDSILGTPTPKPSKDEDMIIQTTGKKD